MVHVVSQVTAGEEIHQCRYYCKTICFDYFTRRPMVCYHKAFLRTCSRSEKREAPIREHTAVACRATLLPRVIAANLCHTVNSVTSLLFHF